jgi:excinuclease ABC subunit C
MPQDHGSLRPRLRLGVGMRKLFIHSSPHISRLSSLVSRLSIFLSVTALALALPNADLATLKFRIQRLAEDRPGTYRMLDATGRVLYAGKAKAVRTRLLSYFRASYPNDKQARILHAASDIRFDYTPSEFAASLAELRLIRKHRPPFNVAMNRSKKYAFLVLTDEPAPRLLATSTPDRHRGRSWGPLPSPARAQDAARVLSDLLGLRDCRADMPLHYTEQADLFAEPRRAACARYDFGTCLGPCAGATTESAYLERVESAAAFCEGRTVQPMDRVINQMTARAEGDDFEGALRWREKFESLEWLLASTTRARAALELLSFVYRDPGAQGDDRIYLIRTGEVRACYPDPVSPIEREAFAAVVREEEARPATLTGRIDADRLHERILVMAWFRAHPEAWRRTTPMSEWNA